MVSWLGSLEEAAERLGSHVPVEVTNAPRASGGRSAAAARARRGPTSFSPCGPASLWSSRPRRPAASPSWMASRPSRPPPSG
eukprot:4992704-Alexandrium_andersonii.AAC.1